MKAFIIILIASILLSCSATHILKDCYCVETSIDCEICNDS